MYLNKMSNPEQIYCILDYETRSEIDIKKCGSYVYARHSSTKILCLAWRIGTKKTLLTSPIKTWAPAFHISEENNLSEFHQVLNNPGIIFVAHNFMFERLISEFVLKVSEITPERGICTASMAAALALPRALEKACKALNLPVEKDMEGHKLMLKMSRPRKLTKGNASKWHNKISDLNRLVKYCVADVEAETHLFLAMPELSAKEREVWLLDQKINYRGFSIDGQLVDNALAMIAEENINLDAETKSITNGEVNTTKQQKITLTWINKQGYFLPNIQAKTVEDALKENLVEGKAKRILEIRQVVSKTSTAKYQAFKLRNYENRMRDSLMYHGASTGRWSGRGVQIQNFPRGNIGDTGLACEIIHKEDLELLRLIYGIPMNVFSSCLRGVITTSDNMELFCGDYASIEARILFWVAKHKAGVKAYEMNRPIYEEMAQVIYNIKELKNVTKAQREIGKRAILGSGFGMGPKKFEETCKNFGIEISEELSKKAVASYREAHAPVVKLWTNLEQAAIAATKNPGKKFTINYTSWCVENKFLWCQLPGGRKLAYYGPSIKYKPTPWGEMRPTLYHWGEDTLTKKWVESGTYGGRLVENVVQAIARDFMAEAMLRLDKADYQILFTVHDEILAEKEKGELKEFLRLMSIVPSWARGCPIKVEAWSGLRYRK